MEKDKSNKVAFCLDSASNKDMDEEWGVSSATKVPKPF
jgi:hypothetical protein